MRHFFAWDGTGDPDAETLLPALHHVLEPVVPIEEHRDQLLGTVSWKPSDGRALSAAVLMKRVADLCLLVAAGKRLAGMARVNAN